MKNLEAMVTRVKHQLAMGRTEKDIFEDLIAQRIHTDLAHWAIRAAVFELSQEEKRKK